MSSILLWPHQRQDGTLCFSPRCFSSSRVSVSYLRVYIVYCIETASIIRGHVKWSFRCSFKRSVMWSQIVADECWNACCLIVFLSQCNRSRPSPGEHEEDMMSSRIQRVVLGCVSRKFQLRLLCLARAKLMKYYSQFQHNCICDWLMYFMCTCVRCVCVSMCAWMMGGWERGLLRLYFALLVFLLL